MDQRIGSLPVVGWTVAVRVVAVVHVGTPWSMDPKERQREDYGASGRNVPHGSPAAWQTPSSADVTSA